MITLSILIPTLPERQKSLHLIRTKLSRLCAKHSGKVEIITDGRDRSVTTGQKSNDLLLKAAGLYVARLDDDDDVSDTYIDHIMAGAAKDVDCVSLRGCMTTDGQNPELFEHSLKYSEWKTTDNEIKYERYPNHLNAIRTSIAKQFLYPDKSFGEDHAWSKLVHESGLLKTEFYVNEVTYYYKYISKK